MVINLTTSRHTSDGTQVSGHTLARLAGNVSLSEAMYGRIELSMSKPSPSLAGSKNVASSSLNWGISRSLAAQGSYVDVN